MALASFHQIFTLLCYSFDVLASPKLKERDMLRIHLACFVSSSHKQGLWYTFIPLVSSHHSIIALGTRLNYTIFPLVLSHYRLKNEIYITFRATWLKISGDMTLVSGDVHCNFGWDDFRATWSVSGVTFSSRGHMKLKPRQNWSPLRV